MSIAPTLQRYFTAENIQYDVIPHDPTMSSARTAEACRISGDRLAKAIVLRRNAGYMLAVLPASHHLRLSDLRDQLGDNVEMANESRDRSAVPGLRARGCSAPWSLLRAASHRGRQHRGAAGDLYGGGDHETLLHLSRAQFARLMGNARHGRFSEKLPHSMSSSIVWGEGALMRPRHNRRSLRTCDNGNLTDFYQKSCRGLCPREDPNDYGATVA